MEISHVSKRMLFYIYAKGKCFFAIIRYTNNKTAGDYYIFLHIYKNMYYVKCLQKISRALQRSAKIQNIIKINDPYDFRYSCYLL